ncbi:MAG: apolipoprotein N-acyltransferase [Chthoniobacteraceae bacterium]
MLLALCFPPVDRGGLVWLALTPLIAAVWFGSKRPFLAGYVAGLVFFTATFQWLHALAELFQAPALFGLPLLLGAYLALYPAAWAWFLARVQPQSFINSWRNLATGALAASAWTALEWVRGWMLSGFGWNGLGVALHRDLPMIQIAEFTGTLGLTWLVAFVNVMIVIIIRRIVGEIGPGFLKRVRWEFSISVSLVMLVFGFGIRRLLREQPAPSASLRIAAIQPNIPQEQKFNRAAEDETFETLERLTLMAAAMQPDLILWPEASTPRGLFADHEVFDRFEKLRAQVASPMLVGTVEDDFETDQPRTYNSALLLPAGPGPLTERPPTYRKIHLVPFGEYLPLRPLLNPIAGGLVPGDIAAGSDLTVFRVRDTRVVALICFEDTLGDLTRRFVQRGADVLVNITNDGWFLRTCGAETHLANSVFRAVENRRPLVRCGNTGVTALVRPTGHVDRWLEPHREGFTARPLELRATPSTFYSRFGDWMGWLCGAATGLALSARKLFAGR